jgi:hypothetical protein
MTATALRPGLPPLPKAIAKLHIDERGYPVPWFVQWFLADGTATEPGVGKPDFRIMDARKLRRARSHNLCWTCGEKLGRIFAFVVGPMCAVNRISAEPPSHVSCAEFAAQACPFLSKPKAVRREANRPPGLEEPAGVMIPRNPGVALVWITDRYSTFDDGKGGYLHRMGDPRGLLWFAEGQPATRPQIMASIESGLPILHEAAERDGPEGVAALEQQIARALKLVPS